jgi:hypothetical protein
MNETTAIFLAVIAATPGLLTGITGLVRTRHSNRQWKAEVASLRAEITQLRQARNADAVLIARLMRLLHEVLTALRRHEPGTVDRIRGDNPDLNL